MLAVHFISVQFYFTETLVSLQHVTYVNKKSLDLGWCGAIRAWTMVGQSESDDIFVSGVKTKELIITGLSVLPFLFQWENKNVYLVGSLIFGIQIKIPSDLLCSTIRIFPEPTLISNKKTNRPRLHAIHAGKTCCDKQHWYRYPGPKKLG